MKEISTIAESPEYFKEQNQTLSWFIKYNTNDSIDSFLTLSTHVFFKVLTSS